MPNGWPEDAKVFEGAAAIVCYADGGGGHPFIQGDRAALIDGYANGWTAPAGCRVGLMGGISEDGRASRVNVRGTWRRRP